MNMNEAGLLVHFSPFLRTCKEQVEGLESAKLVAHMLQAS
jgi:hypothetical protein